MGKSNVSPEYIEKKTKYQAFLLKTAKFNLAKYVKEEKVYLPALYHNKVAPQHLEIIAKNVASELEELLNEYKKLVREEK